LAVGRGESGSGAPAPVVLMGFGEAMAAIETAWSLQGAGFKVVAFRRSGSRPALRRVRGVETVQVRGPESDAAGTIEDVLRLCEVVKPAVVMPLDDSALWVCSRLDDPRVRLAGAAGLAAEYALDKGLQLKAASQAGLLVPPTQVVDDLTNVNALDFPVMVKPARALYEVSGALTRPTGVICATSLELRRAAQKGWPGSVLVQPLIRGQGEGLFGHVGPRGVTAWSAHRRVRMVNPQGSASCACRSAPVDEDLVEPSARFLRAIDWQGMFMIEFLRDESGKPWFMEINGRPWGSMALARRRGFDYPAWAARAALEPGFEPGQPLDPPHILCRNLWQEIVHFAFAPRGPQSDALTEWPRLGRAIRDVCRFSSADRLYNWDRSQPAVLIADVVGTLRQYARQRASRRK